MPDITQHEPAAGTETQPNKHKLVDVDKALFKETKKLWKEKSEESVQLMLERFDVLKNAYDKRGRKFDDAWRNFVSKELGISPGMSSKLIAIAEYPPFRIKKYQSMLPLSWTVLYTLTLLTYASTKFDKDKSQTTTYEHFTTAIGKAITPETTVKQAEALKDAGNRFENFAEVVEEIALELSLTPEELKERRQRDKKAQEAAIRKFDTFTRDDKLTIQASNEPVADLAKKYNTSTDIINQIFDDESTKATAPLGDSPAPAAQPEPTETAQALRTFESFSRVEKLAIQSNGAALVGVGPISAYTGTAANLYNTSPAVISQILKERLLPGPIEDSLLALQQSPPIETAEPTQAAAESEPSPAVIVEALETAYEDLTGFDDSNEVIFAQAVINRLTTMQLEKAKKKILMVLHQEHITNVVVTLAKAAAA